MGATGESFLPQVVGLFYATFDPSLGPVVRYQVPENLISDSTAEEARSPSKSRSRSRSRASRFISPSPSPSPLPNRTLLNFGPISEYVIPKKSLHGRLVTLLTTGTGCDEDEQAGYRVMGFPNVMTAPEGTYTRNEYMWNLCFVFHSSSSLEAFEPIVRKCARILRSAERDSAYLSKPSPDHTALPAVLEQLFEDLNSYSETSIPLDGFNSLELKLFPFYPNPPDCVDWHVPVALVDLNAHKDDNWDITAARVCQFIDGVNHVKKIAELAEADEALTRETLRHMLYYQVVMMIDIFQYSNMYTLKPIISRLSADETIISECACYVTRSGFPLPDWPTLLQLYSRFQPGITVHDWIEAHEVLSMGIDPRRFVSFGIIKGFLRRVHRWPKLVERREPLIHVPEHRKRVGFDDSVRGNSSGFYRDRDRSQSQIHLYQQGHQHTSGFHPNDSAVSLSRGNLGGESTFTLRSVGSNASLGVSPSSIPTRTPPSLHGKSPRRHPFAPSTTGTVSTHTAHPRSHVSAAESHPSTSSRRAIGGSTTGTNTTGGLVPGGSGFISRYGMNARQREEAAAVKQAEELEEELIGFLDGSHHADEIQVRFGWSWGQLEKIFGLDEMIGGMGRKGVTVIYR
ncbi:nitrogen permease regulator 2 [Cryptococcus neoformans Tu259-1]|uniref:Nitrogen permease regulator 2 n=1 Tax=Cryptococcus neoformans Tu259-1 TaxID=1230072 RepID=A0A854QJ03_CRYNE|nr:nitrogen permease regulator 2 [Cryptococcus neoformans var. grubii Tu259-1]